MFLTLTLRRKIFLLVLGALAGMLAIATFSAVQSRNNLLEGRRLLLKSVVEASVNIIRSYRQQEQAGQMPREQAQKLAAQAIAAAHYGGADGKSDYVYIWTKEGIGVAHVNPKFIGQNMLDKVRDGQGRYTLQDMLAVLKDSKEGYVDTAFPRPGQTAPVPKLQYVMSFDDWNWMVGTGMYVDDIDEAFRHTLLVNLAGTALFLLLFGSFGLFTARSILGQVGGEPAEAIQLMTLAAKGDLSNADGHHPPGSMLGAFDRMVASLRDIVLQINRESTSLAENAEQISQASREVADAARQQSAEATSMAASMEQVTVSINHVADVAHDTQATSGHAAQLAENGEQQIHGVRQGMNALAGTVRDSTERISALDQRADQIATIAGVIKDIADQTNLLALNAAIEAARAGESGRGFAVVADEVRKLAERTAKATVEIEQMISGLQADTEAVVKSMSDTLPHVESSLSASQQAVDALTQLSEGARQTLFRAKEVAAATKEQSAASTAIAQSVEQIANRVEHTSASTSSMADAAARVKTSAQQLHGLVKQFRC